MTDTELLTTDQLRERLEKVWLKHIKLCQDNFLYFVKICGQILFVKLIGTQIDGGTTNILLMSLQKYQKIKRETHC